MSISKNGKVAGPRYRLGDRVYHTSKCKVGTVTAIINLDDPEDVALQGFRYYVRHSGYTWSIPEEYLRLDRHAEDVKKKTNEFTGAKQEKRADLPLNEPQPSEKGVDHEK